MTENNNEKPQEELSPEEYYVTQKKELNLLFQGNMMERKHLEFTIVLFVERHYLALKLNMILDQAGPAFGSQLSKKI